MRLIWSIIFCNLWHTLSTVWAQCLSYLSFIYLCIYLYIVLCFFHLTPIPYPAMHSLSLQFIFFALFTHVVVWTINSIVIFGFIYINYTSLHILFCFSVLSINIICSNLSMLFYVSLVYSSSCLYYISLPFSLNISSLKTIWKQTSFYMLFYAPLGELSWGIYSVCKFIKL